VNPTDTQVGFHWRSAVAWYCWRAVDVVMPDCDGVELGRLVQDEWPDQRILYMSAHPAEVLMQHGLESLDVPFLAKPYTRDEALAKVRQALERRHTDAEPQSERRTKPRLRGK
jgi:DNA-binding response OmpR family regulator